MFYSSLCAAASTDPAKLLSASLNEYRIHSQAPQPESYRVYLQAPSKKLRVIQLRISSDNGPGKTMYPSPAEANKLASGGVLQVASFSQAVSNLQVDVQAYPVDAPLGETPKTWRWLQKGLQPASGEAIKLSLESGGWLPWRTRLRGRLIDDSTPLELAAADFLLATGRPLLAAAQLLAIGAQQALPPAAQYRLSLALHQLGVDDQKHLSRIASQNGPYASQARLYLAQEAWAKHNLTDARSLFAGIGSDLPATKLTERDALALNLGIGPAPRELTDQSLSRGLVALAAFNQATQASNPANRDLLERIGQLSMQDELGWAVRDQANLVIGFWYLRGQNPALAESALSRIRLTGPAANAGRLGLGWAQISPGQARPGSAPQLPQELGALLRPRDEQQLAQARRSTPFRTSQGVARGALAEGLQRALLPWSEMIGADPLDPSVQEAMLAIPYALTHLGAHEDALQKLNDSTAYLQTLTGLLHAALTSADLGNKLLGENRPGWESWETGITHTGGSRWWRQDPPPADFYLERLLRSGRLDDQLSACTQLKDAQQLLSNRDASSLSSDTNALMSRLNIAATDCKGNVVAAAKSIIAGWTTTVDRYLAESRLALARIHDGGPGIVASAYSRR